MFQTALDNQRVRLDFEQLLGIGHLRPAQLLGHLRPHLRRIAVNRLTACDDHGGTDFAQRARQRIGGRQRIGTRELAVGQQITAVGAAEHGVADDVGCTRGAHGQDMHGRTLRLVLQSERHFEGVQIFGIEDCRQSGAVDRPFGRHRILTHVAGIGHLLCQYNDFQRFFHSYSFKLALYIHEKRQVSHRKTRRKSYWSVPSCACRIIA